MASALGLPAVLDNDLNVMALGELNAGVARSLDSFLLSRSAQASGAGSSCEASRIAASTAAAGDVGHIRADTTEPACACGNIGCLEAFFGDTACFSVDDTATVRIL